MSELPVERNAAAAAIRAVGATPTMFEQFGGRDADPEDAYLGEVETSDLYIGIIGRRYGKLLPSRFSATHAEYLHAEKNGQRIAVWATNTVDREGHEQSFLDEVRSFHVAPEFSSVDDLQAQIQERVKAISAEDLAPWCKLDNVVFRATEVVDRGTELIITARVRSDDVAHALEQFRPDRWSRRSEVRFTWAGRSRHVRVVNVESKTTTARSREMRLQCEVVEAPQDFRLEMTVNNWTPDELTEAAIRTALFGEPNPLSDQYLGFFVDIPDPLQPLREARVPDEIIRSLAELLIVDALVGSGRSTRVTQFKLGVSVRGTRQLTLSWETRSRYHGEPITPRTVKGTIRM